MAKNASPTPSPRESMPTPVTGTARSPTTSAPWVARTISCTVKAGTLIPRSRQQLAGHLTIVEVQDVTAHNLVGLVALPRDEHGVAGPGPAQGVGDGAAPIGLGHVACRLHPGSPDADDDLVDDGFGAFRAWIVRGDPHPVAEARGDVPHEWALAAVTIAATA